MGVQLDYTNSDGATLTHVSVASPLPVTVNGTTGNTAAAPTGAAVPANAGYTGFNSGGNLTGVSTASPLPVSGVVGTPITAASGNQTNANAVATLAGATGKTTYITGFQCTASGATTALPVNVTVTGVITGTMTYTFTFPAGVLIAATPLLVTFPTPVPASAANTAIVVTLPASGLGGTNAACNAQGYQL